MIPVLNPSQFLTEALPSVHRSIPGNGYLICFLYICSEVYRYHAVLMRKQFDDNSSIKDMRIAKELIVKGEKELFDKAHWHPRKCKFINCFENNTNLLTYMWLCSPWFTWGCCLCQGSPTSRLGSWLLASYWKGTISGLLRSSRATQNRVHASMAEEIWQDNCTTSLIFQIKCSVIENYVY